MKTSDKEKLIGISITEKINRLLGLDITNYQISKLAGTKENTVRRLRAEFEKPAEERNYKTSLYNAEKFSDAFDRLLKDGAFEDLDKDTPVGLSLREKTKYVLRMDVSMKELADMLDLPYVNVTKIKTSTKGLDMVRLNNLVHFETLFNSLVLSDMINLEQKSDHDLAINRPTNNFKKDIYKELREFRYGNYLVIDEYDFETHKEIIDLIDSAFDNIKDNFSFKYTDSIIDDDYTVQFDFKIVINSLESTFSIRCVTTKIPKV